MMMMLLKEEKKENKKGKGKRDGKERRGRRAVLILSWDITHGHQNVNSV